MPRPAKKKTRVLAEAQRTGELKAENKFRAKVFKNKKQFQNWLVERLETLMKSIDPLELMAVAGTTVLIKQGIDWAQVAVATAEFNIFNKILTADWIGSFQAIIAWVQGSGEPEPQAPTGPELMEWVISFVIAFFLVRHGEALINAGGNMLGVAKGLIGAL